MHRLALVLSIALIAGCSPPPDTATHQPAAHAPPFPIPIIELFGSSAELGEQHGRQLQAPIHELFDQYLKPYYATDLQRFFALTAAEGYAQQLLPEHRAEVEALAIAVRLDQRQVMLAQCFLDLSPVVACSSITLPASAAPDGIARFARNLDFPGRNIADKHTVLLIYHPNGRYAFAAVSWPGLIGVLSGMNEHGLTLANMEVTRAGALAHAMPYTVLYRAILEQCRTVDQAIALLQTTPRQTPNNLMLMDAAGNRAVVEITPDAIAVRRARDDAPLISTNHQRGQDAATPGRCWRYDLLNVSSQRDFGHIDVAGLESMLARAAQGNMTLQSMVFEPSQRVIYLAVGLNAPSGRFYRMDLRRYFNNHDRPSTNPLPVGSSR